MTDSELPSIAATLVTDGSSDKVLLPIIRWLLGQLTPATVELQWADMRLIIDCPKGLGPRLTRAVKEFPCQLLFVHRDAEKQDPQLRYDEIEAAVAVSCAHVAVVPVKMQEAWLLHDEAAIRRAAGSPSGTQPLHLPPAKKWESLSDPKRLLHDALRNASGLKGRRAKAFRPRVAVHRLADLIEDWSPLRQLEAFVRFERDTRAALAEFGPPTDPAV